MELPVDYSALDWWDRKSVRLEYVKRQKGLCHHCKAPLSGMPAEKVARLKVKQSLFPATFFANPVHLHHNHNTGMTIGAVHCHCNAVLWQYHGE